MKIRVALALVIVFAVSSAVKSDASSQELKDPLPEVAAPTITSAPSKAELEDLAVAAEEFDLSMEEAIKQYGWRDNFSLLVGRMFEDLPNDFARAESGDGNTAWIAFAGEQPRQTLEPLEEFLAAFPHVSVQVRSNVGYTASELNDAVVAIHEATMARPEVTDAVTEFVSSDGLISVTASTVQDGPTLSPGDLRSTSLKLAEVARLPASVGVRAEVVPGAKLSGDDSNSSHYGGEIITGWNCTTGFGTRNFSSTSGTRGISTAGHCGNSGLSDDGKSLTYQSGYDGHWGDYQWHTGAGTETDNFYSGNSSTLETNWRDTSSVAWASPGDWLCTNGRNTKKECDRVRNSGVCHSENCNMFGMENREQGGGDSGGPVFNGNTAYGLHEGWYTSGGKQRDTKSQANYMPTSIFAWVATN